MDATRLGFGNNRFDHVFSVGLFHHVSDRQAADIIREMVRVCRPRGRVVIVDAIFPTNTVNFIGHVVNRLDRGKFMRRFKALSNLLEVEGLRLLDRSVMRSFPMEVGAFHFEVERWKESS
jgi:ubiquinone/menaquinone biosynthesis C-methylase UbiE